MELRRKARNRHEESIVMTEEQKRGDHLIWKKEESRTRKPKERVGSTEEGTHVENCGSDIFSKEKNTIKSVN